MRLGSGSHVYDIAEGWAKLPSSIKFGYAHGVVVDSQDRVYVHNKSKDAITVFDREGNYLTSWGEEFSLVAHGMFLSKEDDNEYLYLAVADAHKVVKTTLDGKIIFTLGVPDHPVYDSQFTYNPTDVAVAPNGDFYVCDGYGQNMIHHYDPHARLISSWGGLGADPGKMNCPHGIWIDTRGLEPLVYVADRANNRIQVFTMEGKHAKFITDDIDYPCCFYEYEEDMYIPDLHSRMTILDRNNKLITHLGEDKEAWKNDGWPRRPVSERTTAKFVAPHAACVDSHGDIYVVEFVPDGRLTKLIRVK